MSGIRSIESENSIEQAEKVGQLLESTRESIRETTEHIDTETVIVELQTNPTSQLSSQIKCLMQLGLESELQGLYEQLMEDPQYSILENPEVTLGLVYAAIHNKTEWGIQTLEKAVNGQTISFDTSPDASSISASKLTETLMEDKDKAIEAIEVINALCDRGMKPALFADSIKFIMEASPKQEVFSAVFAFIEKSGGFEENEDTSQKWASTLTKACKLGGTLETFDYMNGHMDPTDIRFFSSYERNKIYTQYFANDVEKTALVTHLSDQIETLINTEEPNTEVLLKSAANWLATIQHLSAQEKFSQSEELRILESKLAKILVSNIDLLEAAHNFGESKEQKTLTFIIACNGAYYAKMQSENPNAAPSLLSSFKNNFFAEASDLKAASARIPQTNITVSVNSEGTETIEESRRKLHNQYEASLKTVVGEEKAAEITSHINGLLDSLDVEDIYFLRKFIEKYGLLSDQVIGLLRNPDHVQKLQIHKTGAKLEMLVGGRFHGMIVRTQPTESNNVWIDASKIQPQIDEQGHYIAVEPIYKRTSTDEHNTDSIYTRFCGMTIPKLRGYLEDPKYDRTKANELVARVKNQQTYTREKLEELGIDHGHTHPENFTIEFVRNEYLKGKNLNTELDYDPEHVTFYPDNWLENSNDWTVIVRLIDFDRAKKKPPFGGSS